MDTSAAGRALAEAWRTGTLIPALQPGLLTGPEAALAVQAAARAAIGEALVGWKIGATNPVTQQVLKISAPFYGPIYLSRCHAGRARLRLPAGVRGIEVELAFRLRGDLPARATPYTDAEVRAAVGSLHPALEIVGTRQQGEKLDGLQAMADLGFNGGFVAGPAIAGWDGLDLAAVRGACVIDGVRLAEGEASIVLGSPLKALAWLADQGVGLRAGQWVSTGTLTGITPIAPGQRIVGDFGPLGSVELILEA